MARLLLPIAAMLARRRSATAAGWSWRPVSAAAAPRASGHASATIIGGDGGRDVLVFGGLTGPAGTPTTNDLWRFDATAEEWTLLTPENKPRVRMYAASAALGDRFYMFGGWDPGAPGSGGAFLDDIYSFDFATEQWAEEEAKLPYPVSRHAAVAVGDTAVIHTFKGVLTFQDGKIAEQDTEGDAPDALSMCAMTSIGNKVILFGGADKTQQMSSDVYVLDTTNWTWTKLKCNGDGPPALASACLAPLSDNACLLFGGAGLAPSGYEGGYGLQPKDEAWICTLGEKNVEWELLECERRPEARLAASLDCVGEGSFLLQGGYDSVSKETFGEPWILSND